MSHRHRSFLVARAVGRAGFEARRIRLFGIDAPEGTQPHGAESTAALSRLVMGKVIDVDMKDVDHYGRLVATVSVGGADMNEALVRAGAAWQIADYKTDASAKSDARSVPQALNRHLREPRIESPHTPVDEFSIPTLED